MDITIVEGADLRYLAEVLSTLKEDSVYRVRFSIGHGGGIKVKVNEGIWSPSLGKSDK